MVGNREIPSALMAPKKSKASSDDEEEVTMKSLTARVAKLEANGTSGRKKRAPRDPNAPKRPPTAYFLYSAEHRERAKEHILKEERAAMKKAKKSQEEIDAIKAPPSSKVAKLMGSWWNEQKEANSKEYQKFGKAAEKLKAEFLAKHPKTAAAKKPAAKKPAKPAESEGEESEAESGGEASEEEPTPAKKPAAKKPAAAAKKPAAAKAPTKKPPPKDESEDEDFDDDLE